MNLPRTTILIFGLTLSLLTGGCKESTRKDEPKRVADEAMVICEAYEQELLKYDIRINGPNPVGNEATARLPQVNYTDSQKEDIQGLLEKYVATAGRIVKMGDTRTVVFSRAAEINLKYERAQKYLGQFYAFLKPLDITDSGYQTPRVEYAEMDGRFMRFGRLVRKHSDMGFDLAKWPDSAKALDKMSTAQLKEVRSDFFQMSRDIERANILGKRNRGWGDPRMQSGLEKFAAIGQFVDAIRECLNLVIDVREKNAKKKK